MKAKPFADVPTSEKVWECSNCNQCYHEVCGFFNSNHSYSDHLCNFCDPVSISDIRADFIPVNEMSIYLEEYLNSALESDLGCRASSLGVPAVSLDSAAPIFVRVVSSVIKPMEVGVNYRKLHSSTPLSYPYSSCAIYLFQNVGGRDVSLTVIYTMEVGSASGSSSCRMYVLYIDSLKHFVPNISSSWEGDSLRSYTYQEILVAYLQYCKLRGFTRFYFWCNPPTKGDSFFFNFCEESNQNCSEDSRKQRLLVWYSAMLVRAMDEKAALSYDALVCSDSKMTSSNG